MRDYWDNHVLDGLYFRRYSQIVKVISKSINDFENQRSNNFESR